jgi:hypothetical protein
MVVTGGDGPMTPLVVLVALGEIGVRQYFNSLTSLTTTLRARCGGSDASHYLVGNCAEQKMTYLLPGLL